jgi:formylglycine-generating enzyme required for sulfatase activity
MELPAKRSVRIWKWLLHLCVALGLGAWWCFHPSGRAAPGMVLIPAGDFQMGDQSMPKVGDPNELPVHTVRVSAFSMGNYEVTKSEWDLVRIWAQQNGYTDLAEGGGKAPDHPVHYVTWRDVVKWCNARSRMEGLTPCYTVLGVVYQVGEDGGVFCDWSANGYRLPTEAEWEKASRGGKVGLDYPWGNEISHRRANYCEDSRKLSKLVELWYRLVEVVNPGGSRSSGASGHHPAYENGDIPYTSPVGSFSANDYALYDMSGNVWEWCWDQFGNYPSGLQTDPRGGESGYFPGLRGGSWTDGADGCRTAGRMNYAGPASSNYNIGFRVARSSVPQAGDRERSDEPGRRR